MSAQKDEALGKRAHILNKAERNVVFDEQMSEQCTSHWWQPEEGDINGLGGRGEAVMIY
jgi:homospermidine synthase